MRLDRGLGIGRIAERSTCAPERPLPLDVARMVLCTIKRSSDFKRVRGGARVANSAFVIEAKLRSAIDPCRSPRYGFTVTRKIGNAVVRNRIRRRLKEALRRLPAGLAVDGHDYVIVARPGLIEQPFPELQKALELTFSRLQKASGKGDAEKSRPGGHAHATTGVELSSRSIARTAPVGSKRPDGAKPRNR